MSATTAQPITGHANQSAPLGAVAILVGALALGAVGLAIGQGYKSAPAAGVVPADVQAAILMHSRSEFNDRWNAPATGFPSAVSGEATGGTTDRSPRSGGHHPR